MANLVQYEYEGNLISFEIDEEIMINATEMAKPFGKKVNDFLRLKQTKEYINALVDKMLSDTGIPVSLNTKLEQIIAKYIVKVIKGNSSKIKNQGTWMHQELALKFAAWLSPKFEVWVFQQMKTLLKTGSVSLIQNQTGFTEAQKAYLEATFATKQDLKDLEATFATKQDLEALSEFLINEHDWNKGVTVIDEFMTYVGQMLRQIEANQHNQDMLLSNLEETLESLDVDILKKAVRHILSSAKIITSDIPHYIYLFKESHTGFYKIGNSKDPLTRKGQFGLWQDLILVHEIQVSSKAKATLVEKLLHHIFSDKALGKEWFALSPEEKDFFCSL